MEPHAAVQRPVGWRRVLLAGTWALWLPLYLAWVALFLLFGVLVYIPYWALLKYIRNRRLEREMARAGRRTTWAALEEIAQPGGMLILDTPFGGWKQLRAWWAQDAVPLPEGADIDDPGGWNLAALWAHKHHTGPLGTALLVDQGSAGTIEARVRAFTSQHPHVRTIPINSFVVNMRGFRAPDQPSGGIGGAGWAPSDGAGSVGGGASSSS